MNEAERLRAYRRDLHQIPEVDMDLPKTIAYVRARLAELGDACKVLIPCESAVCAFFSRDNTRTTAFRTDMDALPIAEMTGLPFASRHAGKMHACGHDGHMAMALVLCEWLADHKDELPRNVLVIFQPAEETSGGAQRICNTGLLEHYGVDRIFGCHLWPDLPKGLVASRPGPLLASSNEIDVTFTGRAAHIAKWQQGRDALLASSRFVSAAYDRIEMMGAEEPILLRFGHMQAGTVRNAIAASAEVHGSLRTFSEKDRDNACEVITSAATWAAASTGCVSTVSYSDGNPPVVNNRNLFKQIESLLPDLGKVPEPLLIAEDFACYQRQVPGVFLLLGTGTGIPLHADTFNFDEAILQVGLDTYKRLALME